MSTKSKSKTQIKNSLDLYKFDETPMIVISKELSCQINWLHRSVGKTEWSGILLYEILEGSIEDPGNMLIKAQRMFLMDIGSSAYTEYENDVESILQLDEQYPEYAEGRWQMGHIHTHHSMGASFSGTDNDELVENSETYNYYLSLVVDFKCDPEARIAVKGSMEKTTFTYIGEDGKRVEKQQEPEEIVGLYHCLVSFEVGEEFSERFQQIKKEYDKRNKSVKKYNGGTRPIGYGQPYGGWGEDYGYGWGNSHYPKNSHNPGSSKTVGNGVNSQGVRDINQGTISMYLYKLLNIYPKLKGSTYGSVVNELKHSTPKDKGSIDSFIKKIDEHVEDVAMQYIGNNFLLTDQEYMDLYSGCIDLLEEHKQDKTIRALISLFKEYLGILDDLEELDQMEVN